MKEFNAETGGRYTYADDLENLQELSLAITQIFDDCDNFIVSGCEVNGISITPGYVFLNGKLRYFNGASGIVSWPQYICEYNSTEDVPYESGGLKIGRNNYSCIIRSQLPSENDQLTNALPQTIRINSNGGLRMKDAFVGKYALLLDPANGSQTINSDVNFAKDIQTSGIITSNNSVIVKSGSISAIMAHNDDSFVIKYSSPNNKRYELRFVDNQGFSFYVDSNLLATIGTSITFYKPISAPTGSFNGLVLSGDHLYQGTANSSATVFINLYSYNAGITQYRNTCIGNGKGNTVISVTGSKSSVDINGVTTISTGAVENSLILKSTLAMTNVNMKNAIAWVDSGDNILAKMGFINTLGHKLHILCNSYDIQITSADKVNIGPRIAENGMLLSDKYILASTFNTVIDTKAAADSVYTKDAADTKFATKTGGLSQFITGSITKASCCSAIGAATTSDLNSYARLSSFLGDMATSSENKQKIRQNIGAVGTGEAEPRLTDSGWIKLTGTSSLYIRRVGQIVCIQGSTKTIHSGTVFTIPEAIPTPRYTVSFTTAIDNKHSWVCRISAGYRNCEVHYCDGSCDQDVYFSITYMI